MRENQCVDSATGAAWIAAGISAASAVVAVLQARHAKASAESARSQAESAIRQARAAESDVLLTRLRMSAGGNDAAALMMFEAHKASMRYLRVAADLLDNILVVWSLSERARRVKRFGMIGFMWTNVEAAVSIGLGGRIKRQRLNVLKNSASLAHREDSAYDYVRLLQPEPSLMHAIKTKHERIMKMRDGLGLTGPGFHNQLACVRVFDMEYIGEGLAYVVADAGKLREEIDGLLADPSLLSG